MDRKKRVSFKTTPEQFIDNWLKADASIGKLTEIYGGVTGQTISNYATFLRKQGVALPKAKKAGRSMRDKTLAADVVKALNAKLAPQAK